MKIYSIDKKSEVSVMTKDCYATVLRSSSAMKKALFLFIDLKLHFFISRYL